MGQLVEIKFTFPDLHAKLKKAEAELYQFIAAQLQYNRAMLFANEGGYNGHRKWAPLKFRVGQILSDTGALRRSLGPITAQGMERPLKTANGIVEIQGNEVVIGTKLLYARLMNDGTANMPGGVLRPVKAKALMIPLPSGTSATKQAKKAKKTGKKIGRQDVIFRKSVRIPARPFDQLNAQDEKEIARALENKIARVLSA